MSAPLQASIRASLDLNFFLLLLKLLSIDWSVAGAKHQQSPSSCAKV